MFMRQITHDFWSILAALTRGFQAHPAILNEKTLGWGWAKIAIFFSRARKCWISFTSANIHTVLLLVFFTGSKALPIDINEYLTITLWARDFYRVISNCFSINLPDVQNVTTNTHHRHFENAKKRPPLGYSPSTTEKRVSSTANKRTAFVIERYSLSILF